jgi:putative ABC transport system permease protein
MGTLMQDLRYALRSLRNAPGFAAAAVLTLALGIGANTAIFSVVDAVLLRPLPFPASDRLVRVWGLHPQIGRESASLPDFLDWRSQATSLEGLSALSNARFTLTGTGEPEMIRGAFVTADFFHTLGVAPLQGRTFLPGEDTRAAAHVVVLGEGFWRDRFGADPRVLGRQLRLNGTSYTVVGVAPAAARLAGPVDAWTTLATDTILGRRSDFLHVVGRLRPGASTERAREELVTIMRRLEARFPETNTSWSADVQPLRDATVGPVRTALVIFMAAVALVLLIACANVANLMLARAAAREHEIVIRTALGASRGRVLRQLLTESVLLALIGGVLGVLLAAWGVQALGSVQPDTLPRVEEIGLDGRALAFALVLSVATGLLFGLAPAARLSGRAFSGGLRDGNRSVAGGRGLRNLRGGLVLAEVAVAFVLLVGAGLLVRSFDRLLRVEPGFRTDGLFTARVLLPRTKYGEPAKQTAFYERIVGSLTAMPGVTSAAAVSDAPLGDSPPYLSFDIEGQAARQRGTVQDAEVFSASPTYFTTLRIPLVQGRPFGDADRADGLPVAIINRTLARRYFGDRSPVGARLTFEDATDSTAQWMTVVGVVGDIHHAGLSDPPYPQVYLPLAQSPERWMVLVARTRSADPLALGPATRSALASIDPDLALSQVTTMEQRIAGVTARPRISALVLGSFALTALLLAAIGIYGVISYGVIQRTRELGIRMALGAGSRSVLTLVLREAMTPVAAGIAVGVLAAWAATRVLRSLLFQTGTTDVTTFLGVTLFLTSAALTACYLPARRAALSDPAVALRVE